MYAVHLLFRGIDAVSGYFAPARGGNKNPSKSVSRVSIERARTRSLRFSLVAETRRMLTIANLHTGVKLIRAAVEYKARLAISSETLGLVKSGYYY